MASKQLTIERLQSLPKVELHRHLEGAMRLETLWEFHQCENQSLHQNFEALKSATTIPENSVPGFVAFLNCFAGLRFKYGNPSALERIAAEAVNDAADDGIVHLELRFSPVFYARRMKPPAQSFAELLKPDSIDEVELAAETIIKAARNEAQKRGISIVFIMTLARDLGVAANLPATQLLQRKIGAEFCALDLAGNESVSADDFRPIFNEWKAAGRGITIHAGEDLTASGPGNVRSAIQWNADRIGHGVRAIEDSSLLSELATQQIALELCPTSNFQTRACASLSQHPIRAMLQQKIRTTINTDDPSISGITLSSEYLRAHRECSLSFEELRQCAINAAEAAFIRSEEKRGLVARIKSAWVAKFEDRDPKSSS